MKLDREQLKNRPELAYVDGSHSDDAVYQSALANEARRTTEEVRSDAKKEAAYMTYQMKMMDERMAGMRDARVESINAVMASLGCDPNRAMDVLNISASERPEYTELLRHQ